MKAEIVGGQHIQIYPEDSTEEKALRRFLVEGVNEIAGGQFQTVRNGVPLPEKEVVMVQFTIKGTPLEPAEVSHGDINNDNLQQGA